MTEEPQRTIPKLTGPSLREILPVNARKVAALAIEKLPPDLSNLTASFSFSEIAAALGLTADEATDKCISTLLEAAATDCMKCIVKIETEPDNRGRSSWFMFPMCTYSKGDETTCQGELRFSAELADFLKALKWMYAKAKLTDVGALRHTVVIRLFETAMGYRNLPGKLDAVDPSWYSEKVIQKLNRARLGVKLRHDGLGPDTQWLIQFSYRKPSRRGKRSAPPPEPEIKNEDLEEEPDLEQFKDQCLEEFTVLYQEELANVPPYIHEGLKELSAEGSALIQIREHHRIIP